MEFEEIQKTLMFSWLYENFRSLTFGEMRYNFDTI